jgi:hypothetical protein
VPPNLSEEEEQTYRDELAKFIVPIEEKALEAYESGYHKALELHVFNTWTEKQRQALTRLNDVEYPPLREAGTQLAEGQPLAIPEPLTELQRASDSSQPDPKAGSASKQPAKPRGKSKAARASARHP